MKKFTFLVCAVLAGLLKVNAQEPQFVSKEQQKRNVIIEEFTGRNCGYCPDGHIVANKISSEYPGRVWAVNIHSGGYAPSSYPNLNTNPGAKLLGAFDSGGFPQGVVNRITTSAVGRDKWTSQSKQQLSQDAECNIAGQVSINTETRVATVNVEVYYTNASSSDKNYLTIMMLQDSILGSQNGGDYFNPTQMIGDQYVHMHVLRDVITPIWGDEITQTTAGTLFSKTYTYEIPEIIGTPNGVEVDLSNIFFLAVVSEKQQGVGTLPVLNVAELNSFMVSNQEWNPYFKTIDVKNNVSCSEAKPAVIEVVNGGTQEITSLKYEVKVWNNKTQYTWEGSLPSYSTISLEEELNIPVGNPNVEFRIVEVNGKAYKYSKVLPLVSDGWIDVYFQGETDELKIDVVQDKYGSQITWELLNSNEEVLASGGPYSTLAANGIKLHRTKVKVANNECFKFIIRDEAGNGINGGFGKGYYKITDSKGYVIIDGDGDFGHQAYHNLSTKVGYASVEEMTNETYKVYPNPVKDVLTIEGENIQQVNVFNAMGQLVKTVNCNGNVTVNVNDLQNGMYIVNVIDNNGTVKTSKVSVLK